MVSSYEDTWWWIRTPMSETIHMLELQPLVYMLDGLKGLRSPAASRLVDHRVM